MNSAPGLYSPELLEILLLDVPEEGKTEHGFLDITGRQYKENTISLVYRHFLDRSKNRKLANLFLESLLELIEIKSRKALRFEDFVCNVEESTKSKNRIDIFINSEKEKKCVVIESKIFHHLHNDLLDYWNHKDYEEENKAGVLLTLFPAEVASHVKGKFINITHLEWINRIKLKGFPANLNPREYIYVTDFIRNIETISKLQEMNEQVKFYFENKQKVIKAMETYNKALKYIEAQLAIVAERLGWELSGSSQDWRHIWDSKNKPEVYYAIEFYKVLWEEPEINIIIEFYKDAILKAPAIREKYKNDSRFTNLENEGRGGTGWLHFANKKYKLNNSDIGNLSEFILAKIKSEFEPLMKLLLNEIN